MNIDVEWFYAYDEKDSMAIDLLGMDPIPALVFYGDNKNSQMRRCPAHLDALKNTYVVCSPIDYELEINKEQQWLNVNKPAQMPPNFVDPRFGQEGDSPYPMFSLSFGEMVFKAPNQDVWMEQIDPFMEWDRKNDIRVIGGVFNIHRWVRPVQASFEQRHKNLTVTIKRGDPLFYVRFTTGDPADIVTLKKVTPTPDAVADYQRNVTVKKFYPNTSLTFLYKLRDKMLGSK
jgi:hypothetical protein